MRKTKAFTLVEIMIVVAIIGILIAIAVPGFIRAREVSRRNACQENLVKIDAAKQEWALEENQPGTAEPVWDDLLGASAEEAYLRYQPICPLDEAKDGSTYTIGAVNELPDCDQGTGDYVHDFPNTTAGGGGS